MISNEIKSYSHQRCMTHLDLLGVESKVKQLVSMYLEMAYHEGEKNAAKKQKNEIDLITLPD